jgi:hypothetical protein
MSADRWAVAVAGILSIAFVLWFFFGPRRRDRDRRGGPDDPGRGPGPSLS